MTSQHWFRLWLGTVRNRAITWANVDPELCRRMASLGYMSFKKKGRQPISFLVVPFCALRCTRDRTEHSEDLGQNHSHNGTHGPILCAQMANHLTDWAIGPSTEIKVRQIHHMGWMHWMDTGDLREARGVYLSLANNIYSDVFVSWDPDPTLCW